MIDIGELNVSTQHARGFGVIDHFLQEGSSVVAPMQRCQISYTVCIGRTTGVEIAYSNQRTNEALFRFIKKDIISSYVLPLTTRGRSSKLPDCYSLLTFSDSITTYVNRYSCVVRTRKKVGRNGISNNPIIYMKSFRIAC